MTWKKTKIVCTLGPATSTERTLRSMIRAGMDVARLNFSHGTHEGHRKRLDMIRKTAAKQGEQIAVMADLQGPKIRLGTFQTGSVTLERGDKFVLTTRKVVGTKEGAQCTYRTLPKDLKRGDQVFLNDGLVKLEVERVSGEDVHSRVLDGGEIGDHKGINLPGVTLSTPGVTRKDISDLKFSLKIGVDIVALSFVRSASDILRVKKIIKRARCDTPVIAKIEKHEAISNLDEIIDAADGVMVARGDLGVEMNLADIPVLQKQIISAAIAKHKPVITATQMLESMIVNARPTRAEVSDVANAILDGTDAVMLSAETAVGKYPVRAVKTMAQVAAAIEEAFPEAAVRAKSDEELPVSQSVAHAACFLAERLGARVIIAFTESGFTARMISSFKPQCIVLGVSPVEKVTRRMALYHGVCPVKGRGVTKIDQMIDYAVGKARSMRLLKKGDLAVITAGVPLAITGSTNLIKVHAVE